MTYNERDKLHQVLHDYAEAEPPDPQLAERARGQARRMRRRQRVGYGIGAVVTAAAVLAIPLGFQPASDDNPRPAMTADRSMASCPASKPVSRNKLPKALRDQPGDLVGKQGLWVQPPDGAVSPKSTRLKYGVFTLDGRGHLSNSSGQPTVTAQRVDGTGSAKGDPPSYSVANGPNGRAIHFWPTTITLPSPGCWALTERVHDTTVRFVVHVDGGRHSNR